MITNERQYRITRAQLSKLKAAAASFDMSEATKRIGSKAFAKAELDALKSEVEVLSAQIADYEALKSGSVTVLEANSLEELPSILIRARIARGFSQRELADKIGVDEQQIQRYEAGNYASASLGRLGEIAKALGLNVYEKVALG
jgi:ribosome-binding protein aMBF1 (putative translation factor)